MQTSNLFISFINIKSVSETAHKQNYLSANNIMIYSIYLPNFIELKTHLIQVLNPKEINKAERFHKEKDRNRFIICRGVLKLILASYTNLDAKNIILNYHPNKKPYLSSHPELHFNVSHSEDFAVIAVSTNEVGIDIEHLSNEFDFTNILQEVFTEIEILNIQNSVDKKHAFYTSWTRKEAFAKALGKGIDENFKNIPCMDGQHNINPSLLNKTAKWQVYSFDLEDHYLGAIAFESLSIISKIIAFNIVPNTMEDLLKMNQIKND